MLPVIVRWGPVRTAMNGTIVARLARTTFVECGSVGTNSTAGEARPGDACLVGKGRWPAAGPGGIRTRLHAGRATEVMGRKRLRPAISSYPS
jgi:hypothetical protein